MLGIEEVDVAEADIDEYFFKDVNFQTQTSHRDYVNPTIVCESREMTEKMLVFEEDGEDEEEDEEDGREDDEN